MSASRVGLSVVCVLVVTVALGACGGANVAVVPTLSPSPTPTAAPILAIDVDGMPIQISATRSPATPTPSPQIGAAWRIEGVVVDQLGTPVPGVCIAIGPNGCQDHSPRTDDRGVYFIDLPNANVAYDLHFTKNGFKEFFQRLQPTGNQVLNLVLGK